MLTVCLLLALGVSLGEAVSASASYFESKLFNEAGEQIGPIVAISSDGETAFIGHGLYERSGGKWIPVHEVGEGEGGTVALSSDGNTLASAIGLDPENRAGYVLTRSGGVWEAKGQKLIPEGLKPEFGSRFGYSIAVSENGDTILFGAPYHRGSGFEEIGGVWVFVRVDETWTQQAILEGEPGHTFCGEDVALSADGDTALVKCGGGVKVYVREGQTWTQQGPALPGGGFLALTPDGDTAFVTGGASATEGSIYRRSGETWTATGKLPALQLGGEEDEIAVAADEEHLLVDEGAEGVVVYQGSGSSWTPLEGLSPLGRAGSSREGFAFATSSDAALILMGDGPFGSWEFTPGERIRGPEVGRCVLHPRKRDGTFHDSGCTKQSPGGSPYEWEPGALRAGFTVAGGAVKLEPAVGSKITCSGLSASGAFSGRKTLGGVHESLTGCAHAGQQCTSPMASGGEINTQELGGALGVESEATKTKIGIGLSPVSGVFAEFTCGTTSVSIRGSVIASVESGKPTSSSALKYAASKGAQKPSHFVGGPEEQLEVSFGGAPYEPIRLVGKLTQTYEETLVLNPLN